MILVRSASCLGYDGVNPEDLRRLASLISLTYNESEMLAKTVKLLRARCGLTQASLAQRAKVSQAFIAQLESGEQSNPTLITLRRLAKALKVTVGELVD